MEVNLLNLGWYDLDMKRMLVYLLTHFYLG